MIPVTNIQRKTLDDSEKKIRVIWEIVSLELPSDKAWDTGDKIASEIVVPIPFSFSIIREEINDSEPIRIKPFDLFSDKISINRANIMIAMSVL
jgi:hypothetical protein